MRQTNNKNTLNGCFLLWKNSAYPLKLAPIDLFVFLWYNNYNDKYGGVMKEISKSLLDGTIKLNIPLCRDDVIELYTLYSGLEIDAYEKIINSSNEFFDYLESVHEFRSNRQFQNAVKSAENFLSNKLMKFSYHTFEKKFAEAVLEISPTKPERAHILDVGSGRVPYSSLAIATETKKVSSMDKEFIFAIESLKAMNVDALDMYFDATTPVDDYDFVVGKCPCSAIPHIVAQCVKANKPYFMELCNCALPNRKFYIRNNDFEESYSWKNVLPDIDPNVKFFDEYAFNLDASPEQIKKIVDDINNSVIQSNRFKVPALKLVYPADGITITEVPAKPKKVTDDTFDFERSWLYD